MNSEPARRNFGPLIRSGLCIAVATLAGGAASPAIRATETGAARSDVEEERQIALRWVDGPLADVALLHKNDTRQIRGLVAGMSPSELGRWMERTHELRDYMHGEAWQQTNEWLRALIKVQAIYTAEDLALIRQKILTAEPEQVLALLRQFERKRSTLAWMRQASEQQREASLRMRALAMEQKAMREAGQGVAATPPRPFPASSGGGRGRLNARYGVPPPLITSREAARFTVWRELFGGYSWLW